MEKEHNDMFKNCIAFCNNLHQVHLFILYKSCPTLLISLRDQVIDPSKMKRLQLLADKLPLNLNDPSRLHDFWTEAEQEEVAGFFEVQNTEELFTLIYDDRSRMSGVLPGSCNFSTAFDCLPYHLAMMQRKMPKFPNSFVYDKDEFHIASARKTEFPMVG